MSKKKKEIALKKMDIYLRDKYQLIENIQAGACVVNFKCHSQAVNYSIKEGMDIVLVLYSAKEGNEIKGCMGGAEWHPHFLNYDKKKNIYIDNTIGHLSKGMEYLLIRKVRENENINEVLDWYNKKAETTEKLFSLFPKTFKQYL